MAAKTPKEAILDALEDLENTELQKFCSALRDRREEPRIRRGTIENKTRLEIADKLVTTFTDDNAVEVTLDILKKINCNDVAQDLENWREQSKAVVAAASEQSKAVVASVSVKRFPETRCLPRSSSLGGGRSMKMYNPVAELKSTLMFLKENNNKWKEFEQTYREVSQHNKKQVVTTEKQIREETEKLHQFLKEEEEKRVSALKEEEKQKAEILTREMTNTQEQISSISDQISDIEQELQKPNVSFIGDKYKLSEPQLVTGLLIDVTKHLGNLAYRICEEIQKKVTFSPVILDPNTANGYLSLSEDLTSVRDTETMQQLPDNPERFTMYPSVLGSEGISSGTHTWEVEVGDRPRWNIGYVTTSHDRKAEQRSTTTTNGIWCLRRHRSKEYSNGEGYITVQRDLPRITVQLDYDKGEVSFYDTEDMTHIYTHRGTFTEKLYPYLNYEKAIDAEATDIRICQVAQGCPTCGSVSGGCHWRMGLPKPSSSTQTETLPKPSSSTQTETLPKPSRSTQTETLPKPSCSTQTQGDGNWSLCVLQ